MRIDVLTLFPAVFEGFLGHGQVRIAREKGLLDARCHDFRQFATDRHRSVDDKPYGGGPGMVLMCGPIFDCDAHVVAEGRSSGLPASASGGLTPRRIMLTPQGRRLDQPLLEELAKEPWLLLLCGHYEGFDERIREGLAYEELSVGDYVLSGGEVPAMTIIDGAARLIPGVLGAPDGAASDSFSDEQRLLEGPQYTRPRSFRGMDVPDILLSGDHGKVAAWRRSQSRARTEERRPDLLRTAPAEKITPGQAKAGVRGEDRHQNEVAPTSKPTGSDQGARP